MPKIPVTFFYKSLRFPIELFSISLFVDVKTLAINKVTDEIADYVREHDLDYLQDYLLLRIMIPYRY